MRHRKSGKKLNRDIKHRKALFKNMISQLVILEEIKTTLPKAKAISPLVDKLITKAKTKTLHNYRLIASFLQNKKATQKIVDELTERFKKRPSGFTRIIRLGQRQGDNAKMALIELVDKKLEKTKEKPQKPKSKNNSKLNQEKS